MRKDFAPDNAAVLVAAAYRGKGMLKGWQDNHYAAAFQAERLVRLGISWKHAQERLCGGSETWGEYPQAAKKIQRCQKQADNILHEMKILAATLGGKVEANGLVPRVHFSDTISDVYLTRR